MINKFEKQLEKWNNGVLRGAQAKLARLLRVSTATVALWTTGKRRPSKGYAAQMAQLFGLDAYDVMRLFPATTTYPEFQPAGSTRSLRDAQIPENTYSADISSGRADSMPPQSNSVSLPLLSGPAENFSHYQESDVAEWWTLPRRYAQGVKYLAKDQLTPGNELYFIRPENNLLDGQTMLLKTPKGYTVKKIYFQDGKIRLYHPNNQFFAEFFPQQLRPLGIAIRKITDV